MKKHNLWHHLAMVVYTEVVNLVWFGVGIILVISGWVIFKFSQGEFFRIAVGLPIIFIGVSVGLFKLHEIILTLARPARLKALCIFCNRNQS